MPRSRPNWKATTHCGESTEPRTRSPASGIQIPDGLGIRPALWTRLAERDPHAEAPSTAMASCRVAETGRSRADALGELAENGSVIFWNVLGRARDDRDWADSTGPDLETMEITEIRSFAKHLGIAHAIVVGLQHKKTPGKAK